MPSYPVLIILLSQCLVCCYGNYKVGNFSDAWSHGFNHLTVHGNGSVYLGGVNNVYKLDNKLQLLHNVTTGPVDDAPNGWTDVHNKILAINSVADNLVVCGSYKGYCEIRSASDLSRSHGNNNVYVAADTVEDSTVGLVAGGYGQQMLYVGTTRTQAGLGNPFVSGRQLDGTGLFNVIDGETRVRQGVVAAEFRITYNFGFSYGKFTYFINTQQSDPNNGDSDRKSKIARVCQDRSPHYYDSFTEVALKCTDDNEYQIQAAYITRPGSDLVNAWLLEEDEEVLFTVFTKQDTTSAVCMYRMKTIKEAFTGAVKNCLTSAGASSPYTVKYLSQSGCGSSTTYFEDSLECYAAGFYTYARDETAISAVATWSGNKQLTAIAVTTIQQHTVAFLGNSTGHLSKLHITSSSADTYETFPVDDMQERILSDMVFDVSKEHVYVATNKMVHKLKVEDCSQYTTCESCFASMDPYCGWCTLERRCSLYSNCSLSSETSRWLDAFSVNPQCVEILSILPADSSPIAVRDKITIEVAELPELVDSNVYNCSYSDGFVIPADKNAGLLTCDTTPVAERQSIPPGQDHVTITLSIGSTETNVYFVDTDFHYYDCSTHKSCSACVSSDWACNWCIYDNRCTDYSNTLAICPNDDDSSIIVGINNEFNESETEGQGYCPQLREQDEILVANGVAREIHLMADNLRELKSGQDGYKCVLTVEDVEQETTASRENETLLICDERSYTYNAIEEEMIVDIKVVWNTDHVLDDEHNNNVILYKCSVGRGDCSGCLSNITTREELQCGWCQGDETCKQIEEQCGGTWLDQHQAGECGDPTIDDIWPKAGPYEGGTKVTISGSNLGTRASDVKSVTVAGLPCDPYDDEYIVAQRVVCTTESSQSEKDKSGPVVVTITGGRTGTSTEYFHYRDPEVTDFFPKIGPIAGGTKVTVTGNYLDSGTDIKVFMGNSECFVDRNEVTNVTVPCQTSNRTTTDVLEVTVSFDGADRPAPQGKEFTYAENPDVTDLSPLSSTVSGGRKIYVNGTRFNTVQEPELTLTINNEIFKSEEPCDVLSARLMTCKTPNVSRSLSTTRRTRSTCIPDGCAVIVGFEMDGYKETMSDHEFTVYVDPEYYMFEEDNYIKEYSGYSLQIKGSNLDLAATSSEVMVYIGVDNCTVNSLSDVLLDCTPPSTQPAPVDSNGVQTEIGFPEVRVEVGNLDFFIGYLHYPKPPKAAPIAAIAGACLAVLLVAVVIIVVVCIKRNKKISSQLDHMVLMLDDLEVSVQNQAKSAFHELQTEISDLNSDLQGSAGMPVLDFSDYAMNMMFAGQTDHPVFTKSVSKSTTISGLREFYRLLNKKDFLLVFIQTLESQKGVSIRDRVNIGSLLTVALHSEKKMGYLTDVLKTLLHDAAERAVDSGKEKQILRRTETVMEKILTNWFVLNLYGFVKDTVGSPIFSLHQALKCQIEKGPVDFVTGFAKFSLTDDLLLTENVGEERMTVNIVTTWDGKCDVQARVLNIDTISQVKEKLVDALYRNTRNSRKPLIRELDLEWRAGREGQGHLTLQDQDVSSVIDNNWKRINTLQHYGVPDGSNLALVYKDKTANVNSKIRSPITVANEYGNIPQAEGSQSPTQEVDPDFVHFHDPDMAPDVVNSCSSKALILESDGEDDEESESTMKVWHLMKSRHYHASAYSKSNNQHNDMTSKTKKKPKKTHREKKIITELFLPQLIATKQTIQTYVDDAFKTLLTMEKQQFPGVFPPSVKYMFDFLDGLAAKFDVDDDDITHIWKSNSLLLRMWVNILKCPHFVYDVNVSQTVAASLEVITQAFVDSCSKRERKIGKDTPPTKMLYTRDVQTYKSLVDVYYDEIKRLPNIGEKEFGIFLEENYIELGGKFDKMSAISELYKYAVNYGGDLLDALEESEVCKKQNLAFQLEQVAARMAENDYAEAQRLN